MAVFRNRVAVVAVDGSSLFEVAVAVAVFSWAAEGRGRPATDVVVCGPGGGPLRSTAGVRLDPVRTLRAAARADVVVVPTWPTPGEPVAGEVVRLLQRSHERGAAVVGLCLGAFAVAAAGLLDGRRATTHWALADRLAALHPAVTVERDRLWVDEGDIVTSAGSAAGIDCCLHLVRRWHGSAVANTVARVMVVAPQRDGGQVQYVPAPVPLAAGDDPVGRALAWALDHLHEPLGVAELAARAHLSRRSFERRMAERTGESPARWLRHQRILAARELLETTDLAVEAVAARSGFGSAVAFRTQFAAAVGTSPSQYRRTFGAGRAG